MKNEAINKITLDGLIGTQVTNLPMIENVLRQFAVDTKTEISDNLNCRVGIDLENIIKINLKEYTAIFGASTEYISCAVYLNDINSNPIYLIIKKNLIYKVIEISLGGQKIETSIAVHNRLFSKIEETLIESIFEMIVSKLQNSLKIIDNSIRINNIKINYTSSTIAIDNVDTALLGRATVHIGDIASQFDILMPYDTLLPMKTLLMQTFSNNRLIQSDIWRKHLQSFLLGNELTLTVGIEVEQTFNAIQKMKVGDTIITDKDSSEAFEVKINGVKIHNCKIGKMSDKIAVELIT